MHTINYPCIQDSFHFNYPLSFISKHLKQNLEAKKEKVFFQISYYDSLIVPILISISGILLLPFLNCTTSAFKKINCTFYQML